MATITLASPDVAAVVTLTNGTYTVIDEVPSTTTVSDSVYVSHQTYTTTLDAWNAIYALDPDYPGDFHFGILDLAIDDSSPEVVYGTVGESLTLSTEVSSSVGTATLSQQWYKLSEEDRDLRDGTLITGATGTSITTNSLTEGMLGTYISVVQAADSSTNRLGQITGNAITVVKQTPPLGTTDLMGGSDPYGYISTGRGNRLGLGPDDLNPTYISLIDTTYTESDLELYIPSVNTILPYNNTLPSPYTFDSSSNVFNGTDYTMQIRVAATSAVLFEFECPEVDNNRQIYWY